MFSTVGKTNQERTRFVVDVALFLLLGTFLLGAFVGATPPLSHAAQGLPEPERASMSLPPLPEGVHLLSASSEVATLLTTRLADAEALGGGSAPITLASWGAADGHEDHEGENAPAGDGHTRVSGLFPSPDGQRVAVQLDMGAASTAWVLDRHDRQQPSLTRLTAVGIGEFLVWFPDSKRILYKVLDQDVLNPGLWIVDSSDGSHQRIELPALSAPEGLVAAAVSPDGGTIAYSLTKGLGFGSTLWLCNLDGTNPRQVRTDEAAVIGSLAWAPDGQSLAFTTLADSPVAFAEAGLWVMRAADGEAQFLTRMDGGHGQEPLWSTDSTQLYFIARDNPEDANANRDAAALVSSVRTINVASREETVLVLAEGARQVDLSRASDGSLLFASTRGKGTLEVWMLRLDGALQQLTSDGQPKRHPLLLP